ncbi:MAG: PucR family transcriptional regulator [Oscillospiraceae bacterium]
MSPNTFVLFCNRLQMYIKVIRVIADNEIIGYVFMGNYTGEFRVQRQADAAAGQKPALHPARQPQLQHLPLQHAPERAQRHHRGRQRGRNDSAHQRCQADLPPNMRAVVLKPSYFRGNEYLYDVLTPRVAEILPASPRVYKKNAIVTFVGVDNAGALPEETRTAIETLAADGQILVGVSNLFHKPSKLYVYYQQALQAMSFSRRLSNTGGVFFFSDYAFYIMLDRMEDTPLLEQCRHPVLASLEAYDADKNTELYETLKIYTKTGFSKNHTAELMFMHRNTVNYRIQQIENLFSVDFSDPSLLFKLQYSFYIDAFLKTAIPISRRCPKNRRANDSDDAGAAVGRARARFLLPEYRKEHLPGGRCSCSLCGCGSAQSS